jgi:prepilin-type N-terminal cleavage/methylation domain-containing protein
VQVNRHSDKKVSRSTTGFTLFELLTVLSIIGILSVLIAPSWLSFLERHSLNTAQQQIHQAIREAQRKADQNQATWQASFREQSGVVQWAIHPAEPGIFIPNNIIWHDLSRNVQIYKEKNDKGKCETTLAQPTPSCPKTGPWRVQFNYKGNVNGQLGQITLVGKHGGKVKRCVYVSTLLGATRTGKEHPRSHNNKYCY